jgi:hypothetical protein
MMQHSVMDETDGSFYDIEYSVKCNGCGAQAYAEYRSEVADLWNGKGTTDQQLEAILADDSPMTAEDHELARECSDAIEEGKRRVAASPSQSSEGK